MKDLLKLDREIQRAKAKFVFTKPDSAETYRKDFIFSLVNSKAVRKQKTNMLRRRRR